MLIFLLISIQTCNWAYHSVILPYSTIWKWNTLVWSEINNVRSTTHIWSKSDFLAPKSILHAQKREMLIISFERNQQCNVKNTLLVKKWFYRSEKHFARIKTRNVDISIDFNANVLLNLPKGYYSTIWR